MELRHLRCFIEIADELSFTRAAQRLRVAQPSLSVQMGKLEREVGANLFVREGRGIRLTDAGHVFLDRARRILVLSAESVLDAREAAAGRVGKLAIGHNTPAEFRIFPKVIPEMKRRWPNITLEFHNLRVTQQLDGLMRGDLQLGFVWLPISTEKFDVFELTREPLSAVIPEQHPLARRKKVSVKELAAYDLILFTRTLDPSSSYQIEQLFERAGVSMKIAHELDSVLSTLNFVSMNLGCSILPDYTRNIVAPGVVYRPLMPNVVKTLGMIKRDDSGPITLAAFSLIREMMTPTFRSGS